MFHANTAVVLAVLVAVVGGATAIGVLVGSRHRTRPGVNLEPVGVVQGTLLGLAGLLLAFGLSLAVGRYEGRRAVVVEEANAIGTTYLRAELLPEPSRTASLALLRDYTDAAIDLADQVPFTAQFDSDVAAIGDLQARLWAEAVNAVEIDPEGTGPRLYVDSLNEMIDVHTDRVASLGNRVPGPVTIVAIVAAAVAAGTLAFYLAALGRNLALPLLVAVMLVTTLFVSIDLDRPQRGLIMVPFTSLQDVRSTMDEP